MIMSVTKINIDDDMQIRNEKIMCLRYLYGLCNLAGLEELNRSEIELTELCKLTFDAVVSRHTMVYAAEVLNRWIKPSGNTIDGHGVHIITLSTEFLMCDAEYRRLIKETYDDYTLKGKAESDIWK
jgi:hypothetical protein